MNISKQMVTLNQDIAGQEIGIPVYKIDCGQPNCKTVYIQSAVHAAEMQGSAVIYHLIRKLKALKLNANFVLVPNCNPFGRTQRAGEYLQGRFDATTGNNWNRFYHFDNEIVSRFISEFDEQLADWSEKQIVDKFRLFLLDSLNNKLNKDWGVNTAQFLNIKLQEMASKADMVLDLHTGPSSTRHIYSPEFLTEEAQWFNIETVLSIPIEFAGALDEASFTPWYRLKQALKQRGLDFDYHVDAFTIELGSQENICLAQASDDANGVIHYLAKKGLVEGQQNITRKTVTVVPLSNYKTLFSQHAGMVEYIKKAGDKVQKGDVLARVLNSLEFDNDSAIVNIHAPQSGTVILHYPSAAVQVGTQLYKIAVES